MEKNLKKSVYTKVLGRFEKTSRTRMYPSLHPTPTQNGTDPEVENKLGRVGNRQTHLTGQPPAGARCRAHRGPAEGAPPLGSRAAAA
jgi:hypothetical protein